MEHNLSRLLVGYHFMFLLLASAAVTFLGCGVSHEVHEDFSDPRLMYTNFQEQTKAEYILQPGDELEIAFFYNPEFDTTAVVRPDGFISLQLIGDIKAGGYSPAQVHQVIVENYAKILRSPEITVIVKKFTSHRVYVGGEVNAPQIVDLGSGKTTLQAILAAGGFKNTAEMRSVLILRGIGEPNFRTIKVDLVKLFLGKKLVKNDLALHPNDVVYVPKTLITRVNQFVDQYMNKIVPNNVFTDLIRGK